mgnify:FL=1
METLYDCQDVASRYKVQVRTVWKWIRDGRLKAIDTGGRYRIRESDMLAFDVEMETKTDTQLAGEEDKLWRKNCSTKI